MKELSTLEILNDLFLWCVEKGIGKEFMDHFFAYLHKMVPFEAGACVLWEYVEEKPLVFLWGEVSPSRRHYREVIKHYNLDMQPEEVLQDQTLQNALSLMPQQKGYLIAPLTTREIYMGFVHLAGKKDLFKNQEEKKAFHLFLSHVAMIFQHVYILHQMQTVTDRLTRQAVAMEAILNFSQDTQLESEEEHLWQKVAQSIQNALGFRAVIISLFDKGKQVFIRRAQVGLDSIWEMVRHTEVPLEEMHPLLDPRWKVANSYCIPLEQLPRSPYHLVLTQHQEDPWQPENLILYPLKEGDQWVGLISAADPLQGEEHLLEDIPILQILTHQALSVYKRIRYWKQLQRLSFLDPLTEAYNLRYFHAKLEAFMEKQQPFTLALLDLDGFKEINDFYGHLLGDQVLKAFVEEIKKHVRSQKDIICRYGGDEFGIIFLGLSPQEAIKRVEHLLSRMKTHPLTVLKDLKKVPPLTFSAGLSAFPIHSQTKRELILYADESLYKAKARGKRNIVLYEG